MTKDTIVIELKTPSNLKEDEVILVKKINAGLCRLKAQRIEHIKHEGYLSVSTLACKLTVYRQAVLWRIVGLMESVALNWNGDNIVGAYLSGRALLETGALLGDLEHELKKHIAARDIGALNELFNSRALAMRHKKTMEESPLGYAEAINVLTLIDRLDKRRGSGPLFREVYERMSEICHPNYLGVAQLYGWTDVETGTTSFSETKYLELHRRAILHLMILMLLFNGPCIDRLKNEVDRVTALQNA